MPEPRPLVCSHGSKALGQCFTWRAAGTFHRRGLSPPTSATCSSRALHCKWSLNKCPRMTWAACGHLEVTRALVTSPSSPLLVRSTTRSPDREGSGATGPASWSLWGDTKPPWPGRGVPRPSAGGRPMHSSKPLLLTCCHHPYSSRTDTGSPCSLRPAVPAHLGSALPPGAGLR